MSRSTIAIGLVAYFVVVLIFATYMELSNPTPSIFMTARIAGTIGRALAPYVLAGILPLIIWALFRFKAERAQGPIVLWGALGLILLYFTYQGETASRRERIEAELPTSGLSARSRADFIINATAACVHRQKDSALNKEIGVTAHQIDVYCNCYAELLLGLTTIEELRYLAQNGSAPSGFGTKVQQAAAKCFPAIKQSPKDDEWEEVPAMGSSEQGRTDFGSGRTDPIQLGASTFQLPVPVGMCALSEQRHKEQLDFARQLNSAQKLLLLIVPCDRLPLYDPGSSAPANTSLLFDTAEWDTLLDAKRELLRASNNPASTTVAIKQGMQKELEALNAARAKGQRYPATGPELRNLTVAGERNDRVFITFINRFQRPFDRGPVDRYGVSGFVVVAPYIFKFSIFSYVKSENELLAVTEREIDALSRMVP